MRILTVVVCCAILICGFACTKSPTGPSIPFSHLTAEDVGAIDVVLHINVTPILRSSTPLRVSRDGHTIFTATAPIDTVVVDEGLLPKQTYTYQLTQLFNGTFVPTDAPLVVTTLDTTSHNFTWQMDTLGVGNSSILNDVVILSDSCAWAVGEMYLKDSTGSLDPFPYGAAHWNGHRWELMKLPSQAPQGYTSWLIPRGIFAFSANDIWIASGGVHQFDGTRVTRSFWINNFPGNPNPLLDPGQYPQKLWGTSSSDLYVVTSGGGIAHFDGSAWRKFESGTNVDINDIFGDTLSTGQIRILAAASNTFTAGEKKILSISSSGRVDTLSWSPQRRIHSIWFSSKSKLFIAGSGVFVGRNGTWDEVVQIPSYFSQSIRGIGANNVIVVGDFGFCAHFNGVSWRSYSEVNLSNGEFDAVSAKENFVVAVGQVGNRAVVLRGYR
ncbi:MAG: hypothetical protein HYR76_06705 [Ignavibacteria bacterium]|nr:hypothetical protein [Ignavibacteria bacterium]